jgi:hypothetical protein
MWLNYKWNGIFNIWNVKYCGVFAQSKNCGARETTIARQRLCNSRQWSNCWKRCFLCGSCLCYITRTSGHYRRTLRLQAEEYDVGVRWPPPCDDATRRGCIKIECICTVNFGKYILSAHLRRRSFMLAGNCLRRAWNRVIPPTTLCVV